MDHSNMKMDMMNKSSNNGSSPMNMPMNMMKVVNIFRLFLVNAVKFHSLLGAPFTFTLYIRNERKTIRLVSYSFTTKFTLVNPEVKILD